MSETKQAAKYMQNKLEEMKRRIGVTMFTIPGEPVAKGRPKHGKFGTYTPEKTVNYENWVKVCYQDQNREKKQLQGQLEIHIKAFFKIPKSASKKDKAKMESGELRPTKKPDADNVMKGICDALNGIAYGDDSQIVKATIEKWWGEPRVEVELRGAE